MSRIKELQAKLKSEPSRGLPETVTPAAPGAHGFKRKRVSMC